MNKVIENKERIKVESRVYESLNFFMIRTPILPFEVYKDFFESIKDLEDPVEIMGRLENSQFYNIFKEALAISSPSLLDSLTNFKNSKNKELIIRSALRYLNRMTTRTTPFGLFSGVSLGGFDEYTDITLGCSKGHKKRARPDMEWLLKIIYMLESDINVVQQLVIQTNTMIYKTGSRVKLPFITISDKKVSVRDIETPSINNSVVVEKTLKIASQPIRFQNLMGMLQEDYPDHPKENIKQFLFTMLNVFGK